MKPKFESLIQFAEEGEGAKTVYSWHGYSGAFLESIADTLGNKEDAEMKLKQIKMTLDEARKEYKRVEMQTIKF
tara:strand:+ start:1243 stop:1464 length:222 start_codon:yes stop_codon:yes gene_type:complete